MSEATILFFSDSLYRDFNRDHPLSAVHFSHWHTDKLAKDQWKAQGHNRYGQR